MEIYVEPYLPPATVFVIGCGHVGKAVAELAHWLDYRVVVTDDREALVSAENIPADLHLPGTIENALAQFNVSNNTHIVVVTRNVLVDRRDFAPSCQNARAVYRRDGQPPPLGTHAQFVARRWHERSRSGALPFAARS